MVVMLFWFFFFMNPQLVLPLEEERNGRQEAQGQLDHTISKVLVSYSLASISL